MSKFDFLETEYSLKKMEVPFLAYSGKLQNFYFVISFDEEGNHYCKVKIGAYRDMDSNLLQFW